MLSKSLKVVFWNMQIKIFHLYAAANLKTKRRFS